jgi:hypothetical protein
MTETSTRILLDKSAIRLDGRPFFASGPRLFLTPAHRVGAALDDIAGAGFTAIMTPPASLGTISLIQTVFDEAERRGLLVIVATEPYDPEPSAFLGRAFRHRPGLHSYCILTPGSTREALLWFCRERDRLRTQDLFHPIWTPFKSGYPLDLWLEAGDLYSVEQRLGGPFPRMTEDDGAGVLAGIHAQVRARHAPDRPFFCHRLQASVSDQARRAGLFDSDPVVRHLPAEAERWFPYLAGLGEMQRADFLPPDADLLRVRAYEMLAARTRGLIADYYEFQLGRVPYTGRDRFCELALLALEVRLCPHLHGEGQFVEAEIETGHPRLRGGLLGHEGDLLVLVWRSAQGDEFWVDPSRMHRVEVSLVVEEGEPLRAWRLDFPSVRPVPIERDTRGSIRLRLESVELSARVLLSSSAQRAEAIAERMASLLPTATAHLIEGVEHRLEKIGLIEHELARLGAGRRQEPLLATCRRQAADARGLHGAQDHVNAWDVATECRHSMRALVNNQMVAALTNSARPDSRPRVALLRHSYYTLPQFYRETSREDAEALVDYT